MNFAEMEESLQGAPPIPTVIAGAQTEGALRALQKATARNFIRPVLVGKESEIMTMCQKLNFKPQEILDARNQEEIASSAVQCIREGKAEILMKGNIPTAVLMKAVLYDKSLLVRGKLLSHLAILESAEGRVLGITDGGMNIAPSIAKKEAILLNAIEVFHALGCPDPKVALLAAMEKVNPKMPETLAAAELSLRQERGGISGATLEGPISLDLAVSPDACQLKGYNGKIRGDADLLLAHDIAAGNALIKSLIYLGGWSGGGLILGARKPIILLSRSDGSREKFLSIILGAVVNRAIHSPPL